MLRSYLATAGVVLVALMAFPSAAHANIGDIIWKMSGPQMIGFPIHCEYDLQYTQRDGYTKTECRFLDKRFRGKLPPRSERRSWLSVDTAPFFSTGKNSGPNGSNEYGAFENYMLAVEPIYEVRSYTSPGGDWSFHHGLVGVSYDILFGEHFGTFDKFGFKFRPVGVTLRKKINFSYTLRVYPHGFTADEFGIGPRTPALDRGGEVLHGFTFGFLW